jgi:universal stress protein A
MREYTRILCAVDYSERSRRALDCALWWARWHGADLAVLHVHEQAPVSDPALPGVDAAVGTSAAPAAPPAPLSPQERDAMAEALQAFVAGHRTEGVQVELLLDEAPSVVSAVLARADALACDLIVMSLEGARSTSDQPAVGRETAAVMRGAACAVLCLPSPAPGTVNPCLAGIHRIVCPVSFTEPSRLALALAGDLAAQATAHLAVVHVVELSEMAASAYDFDAYREARIEPARLQLTTLISDTLGDSAAVEEILMTGSPETEIPKTADDQEADLVVLGAGSSPVAAGAGRTLEEIARRTSCPILVAGAGPHASGDVDGPARGYREGVGAPPFAANS